MANENLSEQNLLQQASDSYKSGNYSESIQLYTEILEKNPDDYRAYKNRGLAKANLDQYEEAIENYDKAIEKNPNDSEAYFYRGLAKVNLGEYEEAIENYDKAIEKNPNDSEAYFYRGIAKANLGEYEEAIENYDKAIEKNPNNAFIYKSRGCLKADLGRDTEASFDYSIAIKLNPNDASAYYKRGILRINQVTYRWAIEDFDEVIKIDPNNAMAYKNRGVAKSRLGEYEEAIEDYDKAIEKDPNYFPAYFNRGLAKAKVGRNEEAITDCNEAIEIDKRNVNAYFIASDANIKLGNIDEACKYLSKLLEIYPNNKLANFQAGALSFKRKNFDVAEDHFNASISDGGEKLPILEKSVALEALAIIDFVNGKIGDAEEKIKRIKNFNPSYTNRKFLDAKIYEKQGKDGLAITSLYEFFKTEKDAFEIVATETEKRKMALLDKHEDLCLGVRLGDKDSELDSILSDYKECNINIALITSIRSYKGFCTDTLNIFGEIATRKDLIDQSQTKEPSRKRKLNSPEKGLPNKRFCSSNVQGIQEVDPKQSRLDDFRSFKVKEKKQANIDKCLS